MPVASQSSPIMRLRQWLRSVLYYEHWMVGLIDQPIANAPYWREAPQIRWIAPFDKKRYLADPFPWPGSPDTLICEDFDTKAWVGRISVLKLGPQSIVAEADAGLSLPGHLSFPFLFMEEGIVYALPESCAAKRLEIFRWDERNGLWISHAIIFDTLAVADAALYKKDGLFWISYTDVTDDPHDNLNLIYAASLTGPWLRHPQNPVIRGRDRSRNGGGVFLADGRLYRPAQDCSRVYGGALRIMEITAWDESNYAEQEATYIAPSSPLYPDGLHTLSAWDDKCLVDGMRLAFSWRLLLRKLGRRLGRIAS